MGIGFFTATFTLLGMNWASFMAIFNNANYWRFKMSFLAVAALKGLRWLYSFFGCCMYKASHWMCRNQCLNLYGPTLLGFSIAGLIYAYGDPTYTAMIANTKN
jgi:hypothetical protein